jgi:nitrile hydratase
MSSGRELDGPEPSWMPPKIIEARVRALESLLVERGLISHDAIDTLVAAFERDLGPMHGARVVARAWTDPDYRERLSIDASTAIAELGYRGLQTEHVRAVFNSAREHHIWVCTLSSSYPWTLLGIAPVWFRSPAYRAKVVSHPREVLKDFGVEIGRQVKIHVWDSAAEIRYIVVPERPAGTEGLPEDQLAELVTRDSMIGTGFPIQPATK